jgi:DNA-binding response OmpR family regulator
MTERIRALVVDDDARARAVIEEALRHEGCAVVGASTAVEALDRLRESSFELVVSELEFEGQVDGMRVLEAVRWRWPETAFVIVTGHGSLDSAIHAMREGADDYLLKPVSVSGVQRAVQGAMAKRRERSQVEANGRVLRWGELALDRDTQEVSLAGERVELTPSEFKLLQHLMLNPYRVVPMEELLEALRGSGCDDRYEAQRVVRWHVYHLRHKLQVRVAEASQALGVPQISGAHYIQSVYGVGYRLGGGG